LKRHTTPPAWSSRPEIGFSFTSTKPSASAVPFFTHQGNVPEPVWRNSPAVTSQRGIALAGEPQFQSLMSMSICLQRSWFAYSTISLYPARLKMRTWYASHGAWTEHRLVNTGSALQSRWNASSYRHVDQATPSPKPSTTTCSRTSLREHPCSASCARRTAAIKHGGMQISPDQGQFMACW
jgi:hypothetical protein